MRKQASRFGAEYKHGHVTSVDLSQRPFKLQIGQAVIHTHTLIIASGASARWLGLPHEQQLIGHGVSSCATCDGFFFSGKEITVIGGGDSAMEEALFLSRFATKVTVIHRRQHFRASKIMLERAQHNDKIAFLLDTVVEDVHDVGKKEVTGLKLRNVKTGKVWDFPTSAMFLGIGHIPNAKMFEGQLDTDRMAISRPRTTSSPAFTESMPAETCRTGAIARRLRLPARAAWLPWKWRSSWRSRDTDSCDCGHTADWLQL